MTYLLVALGGAVGAPLRYLTDRWIQGRHRSRIPWGTFTVNIVGSLILGLLTGAGLAADDPVFVLIGTGFCGALTTWSTFAFESVRLIQQRHRVPAIGYVLTSLLVGMAAVAVGFEITS